ncbi:hypothetical protein AcV7_004727 [Taiwanofungus camphoratus]|nr:hypothetical protein AcV7_004727 [Antrodia cinnamomea]
MQGVAQGPVTFAARKIKIKNRRVRKDVCMDIDSAECADGRTDVAATKEAARDAQSVEATRAEVGRGGKWKTENGRTGTGTRGGGEERASPYTPRGDAQPPNAPALRPGLAVLAR